MGSTAVTTTYKPELHPHCFISLTKDRALAEEAGDISKGLCRSKLVAGARVLDIRRATDESKRHWESVVQTELGRHHAGIQSFEGWIQACNSGEVMRMHTTDREYGEKMVRSIKTSQDHSLPYAERQVAHLIVQNFTRQWIETLVSPAKSAGYDALVCSEIDRFRPQGPKACTNMHVFTPKALTAPEWVSKPDEFLMQEHLRELREIEWFIEEPLDA